MILRALGARWRGSFPAQLLLATAEGIQQCNSSDQDDGSEYEEIAALQPPSALRDREAASTRYSRATLTLRRHPIEETVSTPDGRELRLRVGVVPDSYIRKRDLATVDVELFEGERLLAAVNTLLSPRDDSDARALARVIVAGLGDGTLAPTAGALERVATRSS